MPLVEPLEPRRLLSSPLVNVTARRALDFEGGPPRFFYIRRDTGDLSKPLSVSFTLGGVAKQGIDYSTIGSRATIKSGTWLRRIEIDAFSDSIAEINESVTLTLAPRSRYTIGTPFSATIRVADAPTPSLGTKITWSTVAAAPVPRSEAM